MSDHAAIVLAAGGSRRLGYPKQLLERAGEALVRRAVRLCAETRPVRLLVVLGAERSVIERALTGMPCELVVNDAWEHGLGTSLARAAETLRDHAGPALIVACDQPALEASHLDALRSLARDATSGCAATSHGGAPGVPAYVSAQVLASARGLAADRGLGPALAALSAGTLALLAAPELALDLDTEADVAEARARGLIDVAPGSGPAPSTRLR